jgi:hypothetical protein
LVVPATAVEILRRYRRVAVVGLSDRPERPSYGVARYLQAAGYAIVPVNPAVRAVLGVTAVARLADVPPPVEIVEIFRRSELVAPVVDDAIATGARAIWMQDGVVDAAAAARAEAAGLLVVMDRCMLRDHAALKGTGAI